MLTWSDANLSYRRNNRECARQMLDGILLQSSQVSRVRTQAAGGLVTRMEIKLVPLPCSAVREAHGQMVVKNAKSVRIVF